MQIKAYESHTQQNIILSDYFPGSLFSHKVVLSKNIDPNSEDHRVHIDCPQLSVNQAELGLIYSDVLLRAASLAHSFDSAMSLYGNTKQSIFLPKLGSESIKEWGYTVQITQSNQFTFNDFLDFPFPIIVTKQNNQRLIETGRLYTHKAVDVEICSTVLQIAASTAFVFDYYLDIYGGTKNPSLVRKFGKTNSSALS